MARWTMARRGTPVVAVLLLAVVGGSCSSSGKSDGHGPRAYSGEAEDEVRGHAPMQLGGPLGGGTGVPILERATPALTQSFDAMNDSEVVDYLSKLQYNMDTNIGQVVDARCVHAVAPNKDCSTEAARVVIEPEVGMNKWEHDSIPEHGLVVARIINYDPSDRRETTFGFPPSTRVWWVVDYDANHQLRSRFFKRNYNSTGPAVDTVGAPRGFYRCPHLPRPNQLARAKFYNCAQSEKLAHAPSTSRGDQVLSLRGSEAATPARLASFGSAVPMPALPVAQLLADSWVNCGAGCCATSPQ